VNRFLEGNARPLCSDRYQIWAKRFFVPFPDLSRCSKLSKLTRSPRRRGLCARPARFYLLPMIRSAAVVKECVGFWLQYTVSLAAFCLIFSKSIIGGLSSSR
jgi:hypothetical protein